MDRKEFDGRRGIGTVKEAINMYGERILEGSYSVKKPMMDLPERSSRARELHKAKSETVRYKESRRAAESAKATAESELSKAKKTVKDLASQIEDSNSRMQNQMRDVEMLKKPSKREGHLNMNADAIRYAEVMRELEYVKQEMSKLKLEIASVLEEKARAEKETEGLSSKARSYSSSVEALRKEIEEANEEQVLVELARIEAMKEYAEVQAQREKEASEFSCAMEETRKKMEDAIKEIEESKELESKLVMTLYDVNALKNELKLVKEMERRVQGNGDLDHSDEIEGLSPLNSITAELEEAKKELAVIREEGFQFMASMDIIRNELKHVTQETLLLKKTEEKTELTVHNLNSKLLRAKSKLEAATAAEEKAKTMVANMLLTLDQLKTEAEVAKKEKALIAEETANIEAEIQKTESETDMAEEKLAAAIQELEAVKSSESLALEHLQTLTESIMRARASASKRSSSITISKFEYDYLTGRAAEAEEIADKKVAAAQAWIEALKASEREILVRIEATQREIPEKRVKGRGGHRSKRSISAKSKREKSHEAENLQLALPRKAATSNGSITPSRRVKIRISGSPAGRTTPRSTSLAIRKRNKAMPNLAKLFGGNRRIDQSG